MDHMQKMGTLSLGSRLKRLSDLLYQDVAAIYQAQGIELHPTYYPLFNLLHLQGPLSVTQAAEYLNISHPAVSKVARKMQAEALLYKTLDPTDERRSFLALDKKGVLLLKQIAPVLHAIKKQVDTLMEQQQHPLLQALDEFEQAYQSHGLIKPVLNTLQPIAAKGDVQILNWEAQLKQDFYRLNFQWLSTYFNGELNELDKQSLYTPESYYLARGGYIWFAELAGEIVGCIALAHHGEDVYEVSKMGVEPEKQGYGIGRKLMLTALEKARQLKAKRLYLETSSLLPRAIELYKNTGFHETPHPLGKSNYQRSDIYMELPL